MKKLLFALSMMFSMGAGAQDVIDWSEGFQLSISDFQSSGTRIGDVNNVMLNADSRLDFAYQMSNYEFMFTKNFNSKVNSAFQRSSSSIVAPDTATAMSLLALAQYGFDLSELYARKLRKEIYEQKGAFSDASFFQPIYNEITKEHRVVHERAANETDLGRNSEKLQELHAAVKAEINELSDFCKTCKPAKKKK